jgi:riboflavin kinase/FMN adenylyltransferase
VEVIRHIDSHRRRFRAPVVTLGNFDGVHRGHQAILGRVVGAARTHGDESIAVTFEPHPTAVLRPEAAPAKLMSLSDRLRLIGEAGVDVVVVQRFTWAFAARTAEDFVRAFLVDRLRVRQVVVGHSVSFGQGRRGDSALLERMGAAHGYGVEVVGPVRIGEHVVSSSGIRAAVATGDVHLAAALLGRPHRVTGRVERGARRGATIGFPTANVRVRTAMLPPDGVYAVRATTGGVTHAGVANVGRKPTFGAGAPRTLEAHLFDFTGDLYGAQCTVAFIERLRGEITFPSVEALVAQIRSDAEQARALLARDA